MQYKGFGGIGLSGKNKFSRELWKIGRAASEAWKGVYDRLMVSFSLFQEMVKTSI